MRTASSQTPRQEGDFFFKLLGLLYAHYMHIHKSFTQIVILNYNKLVVFSSVTLAGFYTRKVSLCSYIRPRNLKILENTGPLEPSSQHKHHHYLLSYIHSDKERTRGVKVPRAAAEQAASSVCLSSMIHLGCFSLLFTRKTHF